GATHGAAAYSARGATSLGRRPRSGDRDLGAEVHVLDRVQDLDTLGERALERLAAADEAHAARALVDDGGAHRVRQIGRAGRAAAVDEADAAHVGVHHLVPGPVDLVLLGEVGVDLLVGLAPLPELRGVVPAVVGGRLLLDDVRADRAPEVDR